MYSVSILEDTDSIGIYSDRYLSFITILKD